MRLDTDAAVIGGGVVGLAVARALALSGRDVVVLEAAPALGTHQSSRNSEVIHAGIYYEPGSFKARLCVRGRDALYRYCAERGVPHQRIGKVIVAVSDDERSTLDAYRERAEQNGVRDLALLSAAEVRELEPAVVACAGLLSPSTGIIDSHALLQAYKKDAEDRGAHVLLRTPVVAGRVAGDGGRIELDVGGPDPATLSMPRRRQRRRTLRGARGADPSRARPCHHFADLLRERALLRARRALPFSPPRLPLAGPGRTRHPRHAGPHRARALRPRRRLPRRRRLRASTNRAAEAFRKAIVRYYPALSPERLVPGYTGIRAKVSPSGAPPRDFILQGPRGSRCAGARQSLRHRVAGAHRIPRHRRGSARHARRLAPLSAS